MTSENDRPSIAERYAVAIGYGVDRDVVLAAGLQRHRLGALLLRLLAEYDGVRQDLERAGHIRASNAEAVRQRVQEAKTCEAQAKKAAEAFLGPEAELFRRRAAALREEAEAIKVVRTPAEIVSARAFILIELKSLRFVKQEIGGVAMKLSKNRKARVRPDTAIHLAGQVLDVFLDPTCHHCDGTGVRGNKYAGQKEEQCRQCKGTGQRRDTIGSHQNERMFSALLMGELDRQVKNAARDMGIALRSDAAPNDQGIDPALRQRLSDLDSREAATD